MLREVCFAVEALDDNSIFALAIGALPEDLHMWFTTRVLTVGNGEREVAISRLELAQLIESGQTWVAVNRSQGMDDSEDVESLEKTLMILREFGTNLLVCPLAFFWIKHFSDNFFATKRHFIKYREVEVAVEREREGARDGCRRH